MYKVLIADDDGIIREDIRSLIEWERIGFQVCAEANNGEEAMAWIAEHDVDLVLTDMYMPRMDGVELIRQLKGLRPEIKFLVMSNYDDFDYVKDAMKYGASDYVLKYKLDGTLLSSLILHLRGELERERKEWLDRDRLLQMSERGRDSLTVRFWLDLLEGRHTEASMAETARQLDITVAKKAFVPIRIETEEGERQSLHSLKNELFAELSEQLGDHLSGQQRGQQSSHLSGQQPGQQRGQLSSHLPDQLSGQQPSQQSGHLAGQLSGHPSNQPFELVPVKEGEWVLVLQSEQRSFLLMQHQAHACAQSVKRLLNERGMRSLVVKGDVCPRAFELAAQTEKMKALAAFAYYDGYANVMDVLAMPASRPVEESRLDGLEQEFVNAVQRKKKREAEAALAAMFAYLRACKPHPDYVRGYLVMFHNQLWKKLKAMGYAPSSRYGVERFVGETSRRFHQLADVEGHFAALLASCFEGEERAKTYRDEIIRAIDYMEARYKDEISLNEIADYVGLSKSHFCKLFKQETGENFVAYLNLVRIEQAKQLLLQGQTGVQHIANQVGIGNYRYFSKLFKETTGCRPLEYKQASAAARL